MCFIVIYFSFRNYKTAEFQACQNLAVQETTSRLIIRDISDSLAFCDVHLQDGSFPDISHAACRKQK